MKTTPRPSALPAGMEADFRVSVLRVIASGADSVVLTTVVDVHNLIGKIYVFFIMPFHRFFVKTILSNAVAANRM